MLSELGNIMHYAHIPLACRLGPHWHIMHIYKNIETDPTTDYFVETLGDTDRP